MKNDPIRGSTIRWSFDDAMSGKTFEHTFGDDGSIAYKMVGGNMDEPTPAKHSEIAQISDDVWAISYLGSAGYTLTVVLDFATNKMVSFASNEKELSQQRGTFEVVGGDHHAGASKQAKASSKAAHRPHARSHH